MTEVRSYIWKDDQLYDYYGVLTGAMAVNNNWIKCPVYMTGSFPEFGMFLMPAPGAMRWTLLDLSLMPPGFQMALMLIGVN